MSCVHLVPVCADVSLDSFIIKITDVCCVRQARTRSASATPPPSLTT